MAKKKAEGKKGTPKKDDKKKKSKKDHVRAASKDHIETYGTMGFIYEDTNTTNSGTKRPNFYGSAD